MPNKKTLNMGQWLKQQKRNDPIALVDTNVVKLRTPINYDAAVKLAKAHNEVMTGNLQHVAIIGGYKDGSTLDAVSFGRYGVVQAFVGQAKMIADYISTVANVSATPRYPDRPLGDGDDIA